MITATQSISDMINSPVRRIKARVELFKGSTLVETFNHNDNLIKLSVERCGEENKFFGVGICQHLKVEIIDKNREIDYITTEYSLRVSFGVGDEYIYPLPTFYVTQARRDEKTNALTIYGYDIIKKLAGHTVNELTLAAPYTVREFMNSCAELLGTTILVEGIEDSETCLETSYPEGANFNGSETLREGMNDASEVTQTIFFANYEDKIVFKRLKKDATADLIIGKSKYIKLETKNGRRLSKIHHTTELGENVFAEADFTGTTQYVRENAFWALREDIATLLDNALTAVGGLSIEQFTCNWRGNFLLEIGDKIALTTKEDALVYSYCLDDVIEYNGSLAQKTKWSYSDDSETEGNPITLGEKLNQTYARVDKAASQIDMVVKKTDEISQSITSLQLNADAINASVQQVQQATNDALNGVNEDIEELTQKVNATMSATEVEILVSETVKQGTNSVTTTTGFTFNEEGLTVSKSGSEMTTEITEDGMTVYRGGAAVLKANNAGVTARNLHAETYLIIGTNSRFEDYNGNRTGCFWIG